jgi:hypothetical protein
MEIERVDFVDIPSRDAERPVVFYRDVLELPQNLILHRRYAP